MTKEQLAVYALTTAPTVLAVLIGIFINNSRLSDTNSRIAQLWSQVDSQLAELRSHVDTRFNDMERRIDQRFDDAKDTWRAELHRVEEVLDARLKHLEER